MSEIQNKAAAKLSVALGMIPEQHQEKVVDLLLNNICVMAATIRAVEARQ